MRGRVFTAVPAAGMGVRLGLGYSKSYAEVAGMPLLARTLRALLACPEVDRAWVAVRPDELDLCRAQVLEPWDLSDRVVLAAGGEPVGEVVTLTTASGRRVTWCYVTDPEGNVIELQAWSK